MAVLIGRLAEGMGRNEDALAAYQTAADSWDRRAAAQGQLRETLLRYAIGDLKRDDVISQLETLTTIWRGDETEIEALQMLARLYTADNRYRDSFYVMRSALAAHPNSDMTRRIQQEAARTFDALFLAGKGDALPAIDALALFYDFRELTPIGRRGDEMIRRLADRLVAVDLLDQAAELLQYQVDNRLQGAARAQVATRLAVIYLMNRKADRALATLRATRTADLTNEVRNQRLLLEARALSDMGRHDVALEVIGNLDGREVIRLRSDIYWAGRHWREAAEQIELLYGERWKDWQPLNDIERSDILRAELGYALGEDTLGLGRFREKYAAKMAGTPDAHAFDVVSAPLGTSGTEFAAIAHAAAAVDTLDGFLRDMQARYPDASAAPPSTVATGAAGCAASRDARARRAADTVHRAATARLRADCAAVKWRHYLNLKYDFHFTLPCRRIERSEIRDWASERTMVPISLRSNPGYALQLFFGSTDQFSDDNFAILANFQISVREAGRRVGGGYPPHGRHDEIELSIGRAAARDDDDPRMRLAALRQLTKILGVDRDDRARLVQGKFPQLTVGGAQ